MGRISWDEYFADTARSISKRSSCLKRHVGAVIVRENQIISTGYNGSPRGVTNCCDSGQCYRRSLGFGPGERLDLCRAVHAEANAILQAARNGHPIDGSTIYVTDHPCPDCTKLIINAGIKEVVYVNSYPTTRPEMFVEAGVSIRKLPDYDAVRRALGHESGS